MSENGLFVCRTTLSQCSKNKGKQIIAIGGKNFKKRVILIQIKDDFKDYYYFTKMPKIEKESDVNGVVGQISNFYIQSVVNPTALIVATGIKEAATTVSG